MIMKETYSLKKYWVCISNNGVVDYSTIRCLRKDSIESFLKGMEGKNANWEYWKMNYGWTCIKCNITFTPTLKK